MLPSDPAVKTLAENVNVLLAGMAARGPRPEVASRIGIGDKTLGFLKAGTGNPTLESIVKVARFFKREPWQLLKPATSPDAEGSVPLNSALLARAISLSQEAFQTARRVPSNDQLAAASSLAYALLLKGTRLDAAADEVRALIERVGGNASLLDEEASR